MFQSQYEQDTGKPFQPVLTGVENKTSTPTNLPTPPVDDNDPIDNLEASNCNNGNSDDKTIQLLPTLTKSRINTFWLAVRN
jgi:hypothetical protein